MLISFIESYCHTGDYELWTFQFLSLWNNQPTYILMMVSGEPERTGAQSLATRSLIMVKSVHVVQSLALPKGLYETRARPGGTYEWTTDDQVGKPGSDRTP